MERERWNDGENEGGGEGTVGRGEVCQLEGNKIAEIGEISGQTIPKSIPP